MIVPGIFFCSSFLIIVYMFIVSKALLISSHTMIVRAVGAILLNPFVTVLFNVCIAVTIELCVCTRVALVCLVCLLLCMEEALVVVGATPPPKKLVEGSNNRLYVHPPMVSPI